MKTKHIKNSLKNFFFANPTIKLRVREIERTLKLPLPSVINYCKELCEEGILKVETIGSINFYTADRADERYLLEKKLYNIKSLYESGLIKFIITELNNPGIIAFGSYAKGEDTEKSDIDIYIETPSKKKIELNKFQKTLKREIQVIQHKSLKEIPNPHLANNIINGIILNNYIEVFK
jgi:predicted nucleotidyltransferase